MFCCLTASTTRALLCVAVAECGIQVIAEAVVACSEPERGQTRSPGQVETKRLTTVSLSGLTT